MTLPYLSIVIPAYNEENRLPATLDRVRDFLQAQDFTSELLIVENGSTDHTLEIANEFAIKEQFVRAIHAEQRGKGRAVQLGMREARGKYRFMCDADLSMPVDEIPLFLPPKLTDFDLAIASREAPGAHRYNEPAFRHFGGRAINLMIRMLALPGLHDTQCGFKCFRSDVAEDLFASSDLQRVVLRCRNFVYRQAPQIPDCRTAYQLVF